VREAITELTRRNCALVAVAADCAEPGLHHALRTLRVLTPAPVMVVGGEFTPHDRIAALKLGADECIAGPCTAGEYAAAGYALIRRYVLYGGRGPDSRFPPAGPGMSCGDITVPAEGRTVLVCGAGVRLSAREMGILGFLVANKNRVMTYDAIAQSVWGAHRADAKTLVHSCVNRMRVKLRAVSPSEYIRNEAGIGYAVRG
jgi:DNA-binding response OmpR family regulator